MDKIKSAKKEPRIIINYNKLKNRASAKDWKEIMSIEDPTIAIDLLILKIKQCIELAKTTQKENNLHRKNWITDAIIISCETKEFLYYLWQRDRSNKELEKEYKKYTKILDKVILDVKIKYEQSQVQNNINHPKKPWEIINTKMGKKTKLNDTINYIKTDNNKITNDMEIGSMLQCLHTHQ